MVVALSRSRRWARLKACVQQAGQQSSGHDTESHPHAATDWTIAGHGETRGRHRTVTVGSLTVTPETADSKPIFVSLYDSWVVGFCFDIGLGYVVPWYFPRLHVADWGKNRTINEKPCAVAILLVLLT